MNNEEKFTYRDQIALTAFFVIIFVWLAIITSVCGEMKRRIERLDAREFETGVVKKPNGRTMP